MGGYNPGDLTNKVGRDRWARRGRPSGPSLPAAPYNSTHYPCRRFVLKSGLSSRILECANDLMGELPEGCLAGALA
jgi:hypothetical protein